MSASGQRPTQKDVARAAGVHDSTVCLALKNHPSIPEATRRRIRQAARRLGYRPDPMLAALAAYRAKRRPPGAFQGTLAWLVNRTAGAFDWRRVSHVRGYYQGACRRARELGFTIDAVELREPELTAARLAAILRARNVRGLLLCPQPRPHMELDFPWEDFAAVTFGHSLARPRLHGVTPAHYRAMLTTMRRVHELGYRRVGFVMASDHDHRLEHHFLAAYLAQCDILGLEPVPVLREDVGARPAALGRWLRAHRPEAVILGDEVPLDFLRRGRGHLPKRLGVACAGLAKADPELAGMVEESPQVGAAGVDLLVQLVQHGECGVPRQPRQVHVEGTWNPGRSLPPFTRRKAAATTAHSND